MPHRRYIYQGLYNGEGIAQRELDAKAVKDKLERFRKPMLQAEQDLQHILGMIEFCQRSLKVGDKVADLREAIDEALTVMPISRLRGMTHSDAVIAIAKHNGGTVRAQDAKRLMIKAGIMKETKNSTNMTHNAILRTERFDRIGPGEFRLKELPPDHPNNNGWAQSPVQ